MSVLAQHDETAAVEPLQFILCRIAHQTYGIQITTICESIRLQPVRPLPDTDPCVQGIITFRGEVISIVDLPALLGLTGGTATNDSRIVILHIEGHSLGFAVDSVTEVTTIDRASVEKADALDGDAGQLGVAGFTKLDDRMVILLDVPELLQRVV